MSDQICSAIITALSSLIGSIIIGFFIQKYMSTYKIRLHQEHEEKMALLSPTHNKLFEDSKAMIVYTSKYYRSFLFLFFDRPISVINKMPNAENITEEQLDLEVERILKEMKNFGYIPLYHGYRKTHSVCYSLYFLFAPPYRPTSMAFVTDIDYPFIDDVPLIQKEIDAKASEIRLSIPKTLTSRELRELEHQLENKTINFYEKSNLLREFWLQVSADLHQQHRELIEIFNNIWNKSQ